MTALILKRLLSVVPIVFVVAFVVFGILFVSPGDPAATLAGDNATPADIERVRTALGLDRPFLQQFLSWCWQLLHGDLGTSLSSRQPVAQMILMRVEPTMSLMALTILISVSIAVPLGAMAAHAAGRWPDRLLSSGAVLGFSVPVFVVGYLLAYVFSLRLGWFPVQGYVPLSQSVGGWFRSIILPSLAMSLSYIALIARIARSSMIEVLQQEYIKTAYAKGLTDFQTIFVHVLRNAAVPIATVVGIGVALLIGGAVVTESVFAIPGIGRLMIDAILKRDFPVIQGVVLFFSLVYVLINLAIDLIYRAIDPRVRH